MCAAALHAGRSAKRARHDPEPRTQAPLGAAVHDIVGGVTPLDHHTYLHVRLYYCNCDRIISDTQYIEIAAQNMAGEASSLAKTHAK